MIHDEGRLDQVLFYRIPQRTGSGYRPFYDVLQIQCDALSAKISLLLQSVFTCVEINACIFLDGIYHGQIRSKGLPRSISISVVGNLCCAQHFLCHSSGTCSSVSIHHALVICVCLIQLHQGKFRVMTNGINALVSEYTTDLIYSFKVRRQSVSSGAAPAQYGSTYQYPVYCGV